MEPILDFGLAVTGWLQTTYPQLEDFFLFISVLGLEEFYLAVIPFIYWSLNKHLGKHFAYIFLFVNLFNPLLKHALRGPRPYWLDGNLSLSMETSYGIPSGHVQGATITYAFLASWVKRVWFWLLAIFMIVAMGFSRVYLGVHFVHDVVLGSLVAVLVLVGYYVWQRRFAKRFGKRIMGYRLLIAVSIPLLFAIIYTIVRFMIGMPDLSVPWATRIPGAELNAVESMTTAVSSLLGVGIGFILEGSRVRFLADGPVWKRIARYILGIIVTVALWAGLGELFPRDPLWLAIPLRVIRYLLVTLWIAYYAPMTFVRLNLAIAEPEPELDLTL